jgi:hypothetical protein
LSHEDTHDSPADFYPVSNLVRTCSTSRADSADRDRRGRRGADANADARASHRHPASEARKSATEKYAPASLGSTFPAGGQAFTGEDGLARLDLSPDGTIIRMAPNTLFTLSSLEEIESDPFTELKLFFGQVYIILQGGELQVKTPGGVAAVRGSMLGISYTPKTNTMTATCLEGHCSLRNEAGIIELVEGQAADILQGVLAREPRPITDAELGNWLEYTPELDSLLDRLPFLRDRINRLPELPKRPRFRP